MGFKKWLCGCGTQPSKLPEDFETVKVVSYRIRELVSHRKLLLTTTTVLLHLCQDIRNVQPLPGGASRSVVHIVADGSSPTISGTPGYHTQRSPTPRSATSSKGFPSNNNNISIPPVHTDFATTLTPRSPSTPSHLKLPEVPALLPPESIKVEEFPNAIASHCDATAMDSGASEHINRQHLLDTIFAPRQTLRPLENPENVLTDIAAILAVNDQAHAIAALLLLRSAVTHHTLMLIDCL